MILPGTFVPEQIIDSIDLLYLLGADSQLAHGAGNAIQSAQNLKSFRKLNRYRFKTDDEEHCYYSAEQLA